MSQQRDLESGKRSLLLETLVKLGLLGLGLGLALVVGEVMVRLVAPQAVWHWRPAPFVSDTEGDFRLRPGLMSRSWNRVEFDHEVRVNAMGMRGEEPREAKSGCRMLAIGDSFTFGVGVEEDEVFHQVAARRVKELGTDAEAWNGGIPAIEVPRAVRWLERHGLAIEPDLVLLSIFLGNDLQDASSDFAWAVINGRLAIAGARGGLGEWLYQRSHLLVFLKKSSLLQGLRKRLGGAEPWSLRSAREGFAIYSEGLSPAVQEGLERTEAALGRLRQLAGERGFRVAVVLIPSILQVDGVRWEGALEQLGVEPALQDRRRPNRLVQDILGRHGIPFLDLTDSFTAGTEAGEELYFPIDRHWTVDGHRRAGVEVAEQLLDALALCQAEQPRASES